MNTNRSPQKAKRITMKRLESRRLNQNAKIANNTQVWFNHARKVEGRIPQRTLGIPGLTWINNPYSSQHYNNYGNAINARINNESRLKPSELKRNERQSKLKADESWEKASNKSKEYFGTKKKFIEWLSVGNITENKGYNYYKKHIDEYVKLYETIFRTLIKKGLPSNMASNMTRKMIGEARHSVVR